MDSKQYLMAVKEEEKRHKDAMKMLASEYIDNVKKHNVGDIIEDNTNIIEISAVKFTRDKEVPDVVYYGECLTKKLQPRVNSQYAWVFEKNITKIHSK